MSNESTQPEKKSWWESTTYFFSHILDLRDGLDRKGTIDKIHKNIETKGANVWLLISAIFIASIGLDTNSPAVIIGAMLISPLMSPILGIGMSIGINDRKTLWLSLRHFMIAIVVSLLTSILYFGMTPLGSLTSEMAARTSPTFLDVMVAFFGGIAGIVAGSRKDLINAVPGVAIATALLPPLCVTGFGIANMEWDIALGSFYLFFLNSTFVSLATYIIVRVLRFPFKSYVNKKERQRTTLIMVFFSVLLIIPSFFKLTEILSTASQNRQMATYVNTVFDQEGVNVVDWKFADTDTTDHLTVTIVGQDYIPDEKIEQYKSEFNKYNVNRNCDVKIIQLKDPPKNNDEITIQLKKLEEEVNELQSSQNEEILILQNEIESLKSDSLSRSTMSKELNILFPELEKYALTSTLENSKTGSIDSLNVLLVSWSQTALKNKNLKETELKLKEWMQTKNGISGLTILRY